MRFGSANINRLMSEVKKVPRCALHSVGKRLFTRAMTTRYQEFISAQTGPHRDLKELVKRQARAKYQRPIAHHQYAPFNQIMAFVRDRSRALIIDSGCGTGLSTRNLARAFPEHDVIGIDKSVARLNRAESTDMPNLLLVRGDLIDLWRLLLEAKLPISRHYLFYPNPWPKIGHVKRRFHAHPVFKSMLSLAPYLEVRTNWQIYAEELFIALETFGQKPHITEKADDNYISLFEKKYLASGCKIFVVTNELEAFSDVRLSDH